MIGISCLALIRCVKVHGCAVQLGQLMLYTCAWYVLWGVCECGQVCVCLCVCIWAYACVHVRACMYGGCLCSDPERCWQGKVPFRDCRNRAVLQAHSWPLYISWMELTAQVALPIEDLLSFRVQWALRKAILKFTGRKQPNYICSASETQNSYNLVELLRKTLKSFEYSTAKINEWKPQYTFFKIKDKNTGIVCVTVNCGIRERLWERKEGRRRNTEGGTGSQLPLPLQNPNMFWLPHVYTTFKFFQVKLSQCWCGGEGARSGGLGTAAPLCFSSCWASGCEPCLGQGA